MLKYQFVKYQFGFIYPSIQFFVFNFSKLSETPKNIYRLVINFKTFFTNYTFKYQFINIVKNIS